MLRALVEVEKYVDNGGGMIYIGIGDGYVSFFVYLCMC